MILAGKASAQPVEKFMQPKQVKTSKNIFKSFVPIFLTGKYCRVCMNHLRDNPLSFFENSGARMGKDKVII